MWVGEIFSMLKNINVSNTVHFTFKALFLIKLRRFGYVSEIKVNEMQTIFFEYPSSAEPLVKNNNWNYWNYYRE